MEVGVPTCFPFSLVVGKRIDTYDFEHDHGAAPADNTEEGIISGPSKRDVKPEAVTVERKRCVEILHDEKRRNTGDFGFSHVTLHQWIRWLPSRLIPHRHRPGAKLEPARELQVDALR